MTKEQRDKLRTLALAATPGEWGLVKGSFLYQTDIKAGADTLLTVYGENGENAANAAYIAAANPATLLALLDRIDELEGDAERDIIVDDLIIQRDYWEERATELAERVGEHFGFDVGEHSSMNCPVLNALESKWTDPSTERAVPEDKVDEIVTRLYRRFKEWSARGFGPDDVTWCEVKADVQAMLAAAPGAGGGE